MTAGLGKFGLPDLGVQQVQAPLAMQVGMFMNVVAQLMVEGTAVREDGVFPVALDALKLAAWREVLLQEGESKLFVKARFPTSDGGIEWMWVHVTRWEGSSLHGVLNSEPADVPGLKAGSPVTVGEDSLFDYILERAGKER